jgi:molybdopterin converting factor subunit 1
VKKQVQVRYFAILREQSGIDQEAVVTESLLAKDLYEELSKKYKFSLEADRIRAAVNDEFVSMQYVLQNKDTVVFLPPVAGG